MPSKSSQNTSSTTSTTASPLQNEFDQLQLNQQKAFDPYVQQTGISGLQLANNLLTGNQLPGAYGNLYAGISPEVTQDIVNQSLRDINSQFGSLGLLDSGVNAQIQARTSADIRNQAEQFNLSNKYNLLGLALSGQAQAQQPILGYGNQLSARLAGLRTTNTNQNTTTKTPFNFGFSQTGGFNFGF